MKCSVFLRLKLAANEQNPNLEKWEQILVFVLQNVPLLYQRRHQQVDVFLRKAISDQMVRDYDVREKIRLVTALFR